jgi:hypothetical protein
LSPHFLSNIFLYVKIHARKKLIQRVHERNLGFCWNQEIDYIIGGKINENKKVLDKVEIYKNGDTEKKQ